MNYTDWTRSARDTTAPRAEALGRVRSRLDRQLLPATAELSALPMPREGGVERVMARLEGRRAPTAAWFGLQPGLLAGGMLLAAATVLVVALVDPGASSERTIALTGAGTLAVTEHVRVEHDGRGRIVASGGEVAIDWEIGRLALDVDPNAGASVRVQTPEGTVRVVGTKFAVERDALGTRIDVTRGSVAVTCADGSVHALAPAETLECEPVTSAALLNRARALEQRRAAPALVLSTVERGLADAELSDAVRIELLASKANALVGEGRLPSALDTAELALAGHPDAARAEALHRLAARLALVSGVCARAVPHLDALPSLTAEEQAHRDRCR